MQALYRRYRPDSFDKVYGQEHITEILKNQIATGNISHAYIFSGSRGTGKTSCAKIFARAINCLNSQGGNPCNECENCLASLNEDTLDIVEMDAASNRRIDDIRDLRDRVIYPPSKLKYKVYIIDEAHMITNEAFNALLKIMEEPPAHLVFILATTEIDKIPTTIQSRCQRYEFKSITADDIVANIRYILEDLGREMDEDAIRLIANRADGAMRDGLSLLDQVLSVKSENITKKDVEDVLGIVDSQDLFSLLDAIIEKDSAKTLKVLGQLSQNKPVLNVMEDLLVHYRNLILSKLSLDDIRSQRVEYEKDYNIQAEKISQAQIVESINLILDYQKKLKFTDQPQILLEMLALRLVDYVDYDDLISRIKVLEKRVDDLEKNRGLINQVNSQTDRSLAIDIKPDDRKEEKAYQEAYNEENLGQGSEEKDSDGENLLQDKANNDIIKNVENSNFEDADESYEKGERDNLLDLNPKTLVKKLEGKVPLNILEILEKSELRKDKNNIELLADGGSLFALRAFKNKIEEALKEDYDLEKLELSDIDQASKDKGDNLDRLKAIFGNNIRIE
ncbi:MAG: DNA polymerase III subunit gamma/tau [Finegoldia sp.]|nr:DNA polymerase III subunit gamma/tau [Finegoldia sp.]